MTYNESPPCKEIFNDEAALHGPDLQNEITLE